MLYPLKFVDKPAAEWVTSETCSEVVTYLSGAEVIGVDTECVQDAYGKQKLVVFSLSDGVRRFCVPRDLLERFKELLLTHRRIAMHNANFDRDVFLAAGFDMLPSTEYMGRVVDTMVQHHWLYQHLPHSLSWITKHQLQLYKSDFTEAFPDGLSPELVETDETYRAYLADYASWDAYCTVHCYRRNTEALKRLGLLELFDSLETYYTDAVWLMQRTGILVNRKKLESYIPIYERALEDIQQQFNELVGRPINIASPKQLRDLFYKRLKRRVEKVTGSNEASTDAEVLQKWAQEGDALAKLVLRYRMLEKQHSYYVQGLLKKLGVDSRLYTTFNLHIAATGRLSSSNPNLQNIITDDKLDTEFTAQGVSFRSVFVADEGRTLLDADYDQLEMVIGAYLSNDERMIAAIRNGIDLHSLTASMFFNASYEEFVEAKKASSPSPRQQELLKCRKIAKTINFGVFYGMGPSQLSIRTGVSQKQAMNFINNFFAIYPGVKEYVDRQAEQVLTEGYVTTLLGRRRYIEESLSSQQDIKSAAIREAINTPIQGTAADIMRLAMINIAKDEVLRQLGLQTHLQVHDELVMSVPDKNVKEAGERIQYIMSNVLRDKAEIPLSVSVDSGKNWAEAKGG